jgi:hypothetical protein
MRTDWVTVRVSTQIPNGAFDRGEPPTRYPPGSWLSQPLSDTNQIAPRGR